MSTRPSVMGPMMSSLPSERHAAELVLLSVVNAWLPHHAVYRQQLGQYLHVIGAKRGAIVYMTSGRLDWVTALDY